MRKKFLAKDLYVVNVYKVMDVKAKMVSSLLRQSVLFEGEPTFFLAHQNEDGDYRALFGGRRANKKALDYVDASKIDGITLADMPRQFVNISSDDVIGLNGFLALNDVSDLLGSFWMEIKDDYSIEELERLFNRLKILKLDPIYRSKKYEISDDKQDYVGAENKRPIR